MSQLRHIYFQFRRLSTNAIFCRPALGQDYKSKALWDARFNCNLLGSDQSIIKTINSKILSGTQLNNLELDVFINIAAPREGETAHLSEVAKTLSSFRRSLVAHTMLPSTPHAVCRLFLDSDRLSSLVKLLEKRVDYGIFPDPFTLNMMFDQALEKENLALASRLAALIMLQEEFGLNDLNDNFALYSVARYVESKTDFNDWIERTKEPDLILEADEYEQYIKASNEKANQEEQTRTDAEEEEEEEEDAEYVRIPFLRNPYSDRHFDLNNPREICGKTLMMLGRHLSNSNLPIDESSLATRCILLGNVLWADWPTANEYLEKCIQSKYEIDQSFKEAVKFYIENLHQLAGPEERIRESIWSNLDKIPLGTSSMSHEAELRHAKLKVLEHSEIERLRGDIQRWSRLRHETKEYRDTLETKRKLISEIKAKKEELKLREQYLYFYDDLRRKNLTRVEYE